MKLNKKVKLLDCTLRDGGYINDWNFTKEAYDDISSQLQLAKVDIIELGILGNNEGKNFKTKYQDIARIQLPKQVENDSTMFAVMMTGAEYKSFEIPNYQMGMVDTLRYAFFKADWKEAVENICALKKKGYNVFAQTMATFQYSDSELLDLVKSLNEIEPYAFYIVDSFGTMYNEDVERLFELVDQHLGIDIALGFHAHNNLQMANANAISFINKARSSGRDIVVDASIYGMGRGAGNAQIEVLMHYLNRYKTYYHEDIVWELYRKHIKDIREEKVWGYLPEQYLASRYATNPAYIWYLSTRGIKGFDDIRKILEQIPDEWRYTLRKDIVNNIIENGKSK